MNDVWKAAGVVAQAKAAMVVHRSLTCQSRPGPILAIPKCPLNHRLPTAAARAFSKNGLHLIDGGGQSTLWR